jgi:hypothetical protein
MCFLIIANHPLEHVIKKPVIGNNWQTQQLHTIINNYLANVQFNLTELYMWFHQVKICIYLFFIYILYFFRSFICINNHSDWLY